MPLRHAAYRVHAIALTPTTRGLCGSLGAEPPAFVFWGGSSPPAPPGSYASGQRIHNERTDKANLPTWRWSLIVDNRDNRLRLYYLCFNGFHVGSVRHITPFTISWNSTWYGISRTSVSVSYLLWVHRIVALGLVPRPFPHETSCWQGLGTYISSASVPFWNRAGNVSTNHIAFSMSCDRFGCFRGNKKHGPFFQIR